MRGEVVVVCGVVFGIGVVVIIFVIGVVVGFIDCFGWVVVIVV